MKLSTCQVRDNRPNRALSVSELANTLLGLGIDYGFNCVCVLGQYDICIDGMRYKAIFGEKEAVTSLRLPSSIATARVYDDTAPACSRSLKTVPLPMGIEFESSDDICQKVGPELLELVFPNSQSQ
jgi:hypothetical protein